MKEGFFGSFFAGFGAFFVFWFSRAKLWTPALAWAVQTFDLHLGPFFARSWQWYALSGLLTALAIYLVWKLIARFTPLATIESFGAYLTGFTVPAAFGAIGALVPIGTWMTWFRPH